VRRAAQESDREGDGHEARAVKQRANERCRAESERDITRCDASDVSARETRRGRRQQRLRHPTPPTNHVGDRLHATPERATLHPGRDRGQAPALTQGADRGKTPSMQTFKVGDKAVYPGQGVGEVMGIEHKDIAGQRQSFYVLKIMENGMKILIPINKVGSVGLRSLIDERAVNKVYQILKQKDISVDSATWNRRYREYMEKIKTGSVFEIAEVLRDLYLLKFDKDLSFGERKMLDTARNLLIKELSLAKGVNEDEIESDLKTIFNC
jgi:CarD family transcriptional regulator